MRKEKLTRPGWSSRRGFVVSPVPLDPPIPPSWRTSERSLAVYPVFLVITLSIDHYAEHTLAAATSETTVQTHFSTSTMSDIPTPPPLDSPP